MHPSQEENTNGGTPTCISAGRSWSAGTYRPVVQDQFCPPANASSACRPGHRPIRCETSYGSAGLQGLTALRRPTHRVRLGRDANQYKRTAIFVSADIVDCIGRVFVGQPTRGIRIGSRLFPHPLCTLDVGPLAQSSSAGTLKIHCALWTSAHSHNLSRPVRS